MPSCVFESRRRAGALGALRGKPGDESAQAGEGQTLQENQRVREGLLGVLPRHRPLGHQRHAQAVRLNAALRASRPGQQLLAANGHFPERVHLPGARRANHRRGAAPNALSDAFKK